MKNLNGIIEKIDKHINEKDKIREQALKSSRDIIIECRKAIQLLHRDFIKDAKKYIKQASDKLADLYDLTGKYPDLFHAGFVENASQELVEAHCLYNIMRGEELPDPEEVTEPGGPTCEETGGYLGADGRLYANPDFTCSCRSRSEGKC